MRRLCLELGPDKIVEIGKGAATAHIGIGIGVVITASTANGAGDELSLRRTRAMIKASGYTASRSTLCRSATAG